MADNNNNNPETETLGSCKNPRPKDSSNQDEQNDSQSFQAGQVGDFAITQDNDSFAQLPPLSVGLADFQISETEENDPGFTNPVFSHFGVNDPQWLRSGEEDSASCIPGQKDIIGMSNSEREHPEASSLTRQNESECPWDGGMNPEFSRTEQNAPECSRPGQYDPGEVSGSGQINPELSGGFGRRDPVFSHHGLEAPAFYGPGGSYNGGQRNGGFANRGGYGPGLGTFGDEFRGPVSVTGNTPTVPRGGAPILSRDIPVSDTERIIAATGRVQAIRSTPSNSKAKWGLISLCVLFITVLVLAGVVLAVGYDYKEPDKQEAASAEITQGKEFDASFLLVESWNGSMSSTHSFAFQNLSRQLQETIDHIYSHSPLYNRFNHSSVIRLSEKEWNKIQVTCMLKMKDRTQYQSNLNAEDLKLSFLKGYHNLLEIQSLPKYIVDRIIINSLTVTSIDATQGPFTTAKPDDVPCGEVRVLPDLRIVGGSEAEKGAFPWMVMLLKNDDRIKQAFYCGGSILDRWHIITAAHCLREEPKNTLTGLVDTRTNQLTVVAGKHWSNTSLHYSQEQRIPASAAVIHPDFSLLPLKNDIAVIRLSKPLQFNSRVTPLCMPQVDARLPSVCLAAGWGSLDHEFEDLPKTLRSVTLKVYDSNECQRKFGFTFSFVDRPLNYYLSPGIMCASNGTYGGQDTCQGDSGGPLFCLQSGANGERYYTQFGIVSWGVDCGKPGKPGFYTFLPYYMSWVRSHALPQLDRHVHASASDRVCRTFSPANDYRLWRCQSLFRRLRLDNECNNLTDVVLCMWHELEQYGHRCPWRDVYSTIVGSLSQQQQQRCQANKTRQSDAVCHNLTAVSTAVSLCTQNVHCVSMLEVTLCVHYRLDPRWLQCTRRKLQQFISTHLNHSLPICQEYTLRTMTDGRQFLYMGGDWHVLCGDLWGHSEAKVACGQRGFKNGKPSYIHKTKENMYVSEHHNASIDIQHAVKASGWLKVKCFGNESSLAECHLVQQTTCSSSYIAGSVCYNTESRQTV